MEVGNIVEYIDRERILCAVILEIRNQRLKLLTENNREVSLSAGRLLRLDTTRLDPGMGRFRLVDRLREVAEKRNALVSAVTIRDLWEVLHPENDWIDLETLTAFCFPGEANGDHQSAVMRAVFNDRLYFRFHPGRFFPNPPDQVERLFARREAEARRARLIEQGGAWLRQALSRTGPPPAEAAGEVPGECLRLIRDFFLFGREAADHDTARALLERAGVDPAGDLFPLCVRLGLFSEDENLDLHRLRVPVEFPQEALEAAQRLVAPRPSAPASGLAGRVDLTGLELFTIDGQATLDFDDALSLETLPDGLRLGVHIVDVAHFVRRDDPLDREARRRGSSIYLPDQRIPMLPAPLAEGLCSLRAGEVRPAITTFIDLASDLSVRGYRILPSWVRVKEQRTYFDVNLLADQDPKLLRLRSIARAFREARLAAGAVHIAVPEVNVWIAENGEVHVSRLNRESPARMLVAEIMILANWLAARCLAENGLPAVFRAQPEPRERLYAGEGGSLFQQWMQRRLLNRFVLSPAPGKHSGLGLSAYVTATSPIRKYYDLVTQRQIRAVLGLEAPYGAAEIEALLEDLALPMSRVAQLQAARHRYWLLRFLERRVGEKEEAIVLQRRRNGYQILLTEYMLECDLPDTGGPELLPEDLIQVTLQAVNARKDHIALTIG
ncbi:MAG: ribonuclease R family protein [Desulfobacterales bacterium]